MIRLRPILPQRKINARQATRQLVRGMQHVTRNIGRDFDATVATWDNKPTFWAKTTVTEKEIISHVSTADLIYKFITGGTKVRYATMTKDFVAKTVPGVIGSRAGAGGLLYVSVHNPHPGIEGRNFDIVIAEKQAREIFNTMMPFIDRAVAYLQ